MAQQLAMTVWPVPASLAISSPPSTTVTVPVPTNDTEIALIARAGEEAPTSSRMTELAAVLTLVGLIHLAPPDAYYAQTLQAWENGRFIRFHGLSRWFGILWPYVALAWLLGRWWGHEADAGVAQRA